MADRTVLRIGSWAAIVGALGAMIANVLHPRFDSFADPVTEEIRIAGESDMWVPIHVAILISLALIAFGLFAVARSMKGGTGEGAARVALGGLLISTPIALLGVAIDGYVPKAFADSIGTGAVDPAGGAAAAVHLGWAAFMALVITFQGVTPALFGAAVVADRTWPTWLGWGAIVVGLIAAIAGLIGLLDGASAAFFLVFTISAGILTLWVLALGVLLARRVRGVVDVPEASERLSARA
ncbi:MAG: hypothetical protein ACRDJP_07175 [Actinomycetota bacterium]